MSYWRDKYPSWVGNMDFIDGAQAAMEAFAVWHNGVQYVGAGVMTLDEALKELFMDLYPFQEEEEETDELGRT